MYNWMQSCHISDNLLNVNLLYTIDSVEDVHECEEKYVWSAARVISRAKQLASNKASTFFPQCITNELTIIAHCLRSCSRELLAASSTTLPNSYSNLFTFLVWTFRLNDVYRNSEMWSISFFWSHSTSAQFFSLLKQEKVNPLNISA